MGVYIKDEKMPDTCINCFKHSKCDRYHIEILKTEDGDYIPQYIADNCPLVEVKTPHGRLIDEEMIVSIEGQMKADGTVVCFTDVDAPTVIEAEEE